MRKFSKLITESKSEDSNKISPLVNPVDWEEIFLPLIEHIESNLQSTVKSPGVGVFSNETNNLMKKLISSVEKDYEQYFQFEIYDGSQESFLDAFNINVDYQDVVDCIQPLLDRTSDVEDYGSFPMRALIFDLINIKYKTNEEIAEDLADVHGKLRMLDADYTMTVSKSVGIRPTGKISLLKHSDNIDTLFLNGLSEGEKISNVKIYIYNPENTNFNLSLI